MTSLLYLPYSTGNAQTAHGAQGSKRVGGGESLVRFVGSIMAREGG